ncbi:acyltransferase family protein [Nocardioides donggukensis]|uniref:Acyltransferase n=1 Tax=Nocardioides donggukensis TaxID=2774019 RepID=A0A927K333_9ACTN|nr:acyltransferase [Nocardioides donggukensis]MBD8869682.1 acyltransferase [Nocardioides donggukensis]
MSTSNQEGTQLTHLPALDTLRAVGALGVLTTHTAFWAGAYTAHGVWGAVLARLDVGVAIFFVLSGFLLSRPWIAAARAGRRGPRVTPYLGKRFLRIVPVYVVTAILALVLIDANRDLGVRDWLVTLTMTDIYVSSGPPPGLTQTWSLATEVAFYVTLPLLMLVILGRGGLSPRRVAISLALASSTTVLWLAVVSPRLPFAGDIAVNEWLPAFLTWFSAGIGLALLHVLHGADALLPPVRDAVERVAASPGVCWSIVGGLLLVAATPVAGPTLLVAPTLADAVTKNLLYTAIGGLLVFSAAFAPATSRYARLMAHRVPRHLGLISYSLFLIHLPVLHLVMKATGYQLYEGHFLQIFLLTLGLSLLAAQVLYSLVEKPFMSLKRREFGSTDRATTPASATSTR